MLGFKRIAEDHPLYCNKNTYISGKFKIKTLDTIYIDKFATLRSKTYAYVCSANCSHSQHMNANEKEKKKFNIITKHIPKTK